MRPQTLERYVERARPILIEVARQEALITFGELMSKLGGPGRRHIGEVLGRISEIELQSGRPKLSAVVIRKNTGMVPGGFFGFLDTPQGIRRSTPEEWKNPHLSEADQQYWQGQLQETYRYWRQHDSMAQKEKEVELILQGTVDMVIECVKNFARREGEYRIVPKIGDGTRAQVAALLTIAATQNIQPEPAIVERADLLAESVVRVYEQILKHLQSSSNMPDNAKWDRTISASCDVFVVGGRAKIPLCTISLLLIPGDRTLFSVQKPERLDSPLGHFLELLKGEFKRLGFEEQRV